MGVYPVMFALLDIERAGAGLHQLRDLQVRGEQRYGSAFWWGSIHELDLINEAQTFAEKVAWVNAGPIDADWGNQERILMFSLGRPTFPYKWEHCLFTLGINCLFPLIHAISTY